MPCHDAVTGAGRLEAVELVAEAAQQPRRSAEQAIGLEPRRGLPTKTLASGLELHAGRLLRWMRTTASVAACSRPEMAAVSVRAEHSSQCNVARRLLRAPTQLSIRSMPALRARSAGSPDGRRQADRCADRVPAVVAQRVAVPAKPRRSRVGGKVDLVPALAYP